MRSLLYVIAILLLIGWALGSFAYHVTSAFIHVLLVIAIVMILLNLLRRDRRPL
ncbi:lmo0937 family membrane protein [Flavobacterium sp. Sd200]|uniref:lmo0937 family membrane protein n=1 Tax=Flavobacterium sp. Sd200 TaxID=2692211 RepID=UPI00136F6027|nr:lmo0937 family membrane protein [Flavobacterium sp. Sd200]MXN89703.1 lmo0937 family membrane protein [Flavobacterium sp. Sd200]